MKKLGSIALVGSLMLLAGGQAEAACTLIRIAELHVVIENNRILIPGELNGQNVRFLVDTAYPASLITSNAARQLKLNVLHAPGAFSGTVLGNVHSREDSGFTRIYGFHLDGQTVGSASFGVFAPNDNFGAPDILAVLGTDFWAGYDVELDLPHDRINLFRAQDCKDHNLAYWGDDYNVIDPVQYGVRTEVRIKLNEHEVTAVIDSGSPHSSLSERAAARLGVRRHDAELHEENIPAGAQSTDLLSLIRFSRGLGLYYPGSPNVRTQGGLPALEPMAGPFTYWVTTLDKLTIDEEVISPMGFRVVPTPPSLPAEIGTRIPIRLVEYDILLGVDFLKSHRMLLANSQGKIYFSYIGGTEFAKPF